MHSSGKKLTFFLENSTAIHFRAFDKVFLAKKNGKGLKINIKFYFKLMLLKSIESDGTKWLVPDASICTHVHFTIRMKPEKDRFLSKQPNFFGIINF